MSDPIVLSVVVLLFALLGVHHFAKARQGVRTGTVPGLLIVNARKRFERDYEPEAFWVNVWVGFIAAFVSALVVLLGALILWAIIGHIELINL